VESFRSLPDLAGENRRGTSMVPKIESLRQLESPMNKKETARPAAIAEERQTMQFGFRQFRVSTATANAFAAAFELWEADFREALPSATATESEQPGLEWAR
jgi:hypothetical protein